MAKFENSITLRVAKNRVAKAVKAGITSNRTIGYCEIRYGAASKNQPDVIRSRTYKTEAEVQQYIDTCIDSEDSNIAEWGRNYQITPCLVTLVDGSTNWHTDRNSTGFSYLKKDPAHTKKLAIIG